MKKAEEGALEVVRKLQREKDAELRKREKEEKAIKSYVTFDELGTKLMISGGTRRNLNLPSLDWKWN